MHCVWHYIQVALRITSPIFFANGARLLHRLHQQIEQTGDQDPAALEQELLSLSSGSAPLAPPYFPNTEFVIPFRINSPAGILPFFSTTMVSGMPLDATLPELAIELFFPTKEKCKDEMYLRARLLP
ncbi:MAG: hypothetical protein ABJD53_04075 [Gammaproteobacteria bacterium]